MLQIRHEIVMRSTIHMKCKLFTLTLNSDYVSQAKILSMDVCCNIKNDYKREYLEESLNIIRNNSNHNLVKIA